MKKPEALRLADELEAVSSDPWAKYWERCLKGAAELRRLHAENASLAAALEPVAVDPTDPGYDVNVLREQVRHLERRIRQLAQPAPEPVAVSERERCATLLRAAGCVLQAFDDGYLQPDTETLQGSSAVDALRNAWEAFVPAVYRRPQ